MVLSEISPFLQDFGTEALAFVCVCVCVCVHFNLLHFIQIDGHLL